MSKPVTIIVIGIEKADLLDIAIRRAIEQQHGDDVIILSEAEAKDKGVIPKNPANKPFILKAMPPLPEVFYDKHQDKNDCKKGWRK